VSRIADRISVILLALPVLALTATGSAQANCSGHDVTFKNSCNYDVWLAEQVDAGGPVTPAKWRLASDESETLCMPQGWGGRFWGRRGCDFRTCSTNSDCTGFTINTNTTGTIAFGSKTLTLGSAPSQALVPGEIITIAGAGTGGTGLTTYVAAVTSSTVYTLTDAAQTTATSQPVYLSPYNSCFSGQCVYNGCESNPVQSNFNVACQAQGGVYYGNQSAQCTNNNCLIASNSLGQGNCQTGDCGGLLECFDTSANGATLFEAAFDAGSGGVTDFWDVSIVSGYNIPIQVTPSTGCTTGYTAGCHNDLNKTCPTALEILNPKGTVVGCIDPCDACTGANPPAALDCATNQDLYCCKDHTNEVIMQSCNSGSAVCFGSNDCPPGTTCDTGGLSGRTLPSGVGVCITPINVFGCTAKDAGSSCPGMTNVDPLGCSLTPYPNIDYTCETLTDNPTVAVCVAPDTSGFGTLTTNSAPATCNYIAQEYSGCCGPFNAGWVNAATTAGGGTTPFYTLFKNACASAYTYQFDDIASQVTCDDSAGETDYAVTFCPAGSVNSSGLGAPNGQRRGKPLQPPGQPPGPP
jgi:hypothetical protein